MQFLRGEKDRDLPAVGAEQIDRVPRKPMSIRSGNKTQKTRKRANSGKEVTAGIKFAVIVRLERRRLRRGNSMLATMSN